MDAGACPGKELGRLLDALTEKVEQGELENRRDILLKEAAVLGQVGEERADGAGADQEAFTGT